MHFYEGQSRHSWAGVMTTLWVSIPDRGKTFFSTPEHPQQLCGPPGLLFNEYWRSYPRCGSHWGMKLITHVHLVPPLRKSGTICLIPLNTFMACTRTTLTLSFLLVTTEHPGQWCVQNINVFSYLKRTFYWATNQLAAWACHTTLPSAIISDKRLHKRKIRFLLIMYISVWKETSVLNHINFPILYYGLFTSKLPLFSYGISSTYFMTYKLQWIKKLHICHSKVSIFVNHAIQEFHL
jgi:hypothetical protein